MMDAIQMVQRSCELAGRQVAAAATSPAAQTACAKYDASLLVGHMVAALELNTAFLNGAPPASDPFQPDSIDGPQMVSAYEAAVEGLLTAASKPGALDRMVTHPAGEMPASAMLMFPTFDMYVHSWDLEQATGVEGEYPDDLTGPIADWCQNVFSGDRNPDIIGEALPAPTGATSMEELVAFLGRAVPA